MFTLQVSNLAALLFSLIVGIPLTIALTNTLLGIDMGRYPLWKRLAHGLVYIMSGAVICILVARVLPH